MSHVGRPQVEGKYELSLLFLSAKLTNVSRVEDVPLSLRYSSMIGNSFLRFRALFVVREIASGAQRKHHLVQSCNRALELLQFPFKKCMKTFCHAEYKKNLPINRRLWLAYTYRYTYMYVYISYISMSRTNGIKWVPKKIKKKRGGKSRGNDKTRHKTLPKMFLPLPPPTPFHTPPPLGTYAPVGAAERLHWQSQRK